MKAKIALASIVFCLVTSQAQTAPMRGYMPHAYPTVIPPQQENPATVLRTGINQLLAFLNSENRPQPAQLAVFLEQEIAPYFDFAYMSRWVAGHSYQQMNAKQQAALERKIKKSFLFGMATRLASYSDQRVQFFPPRQARGNEIKVSVGILQPGSYPSKLDFRFYRAKDGWRVFDVIANGTSALTYYRQQYNQTWKQRSMPRWPRG